MIGGGEIMDETLNYYNKNAESFINATVAVDFEKMQNKFLERLPRGAYILDFGCGSGRDTKYFLEHGYKIDAIDGSDELVRYASEYTGIKVKKMLFSELDATKCYDGIWACSSILHLPKVELKDVLVKMSRALKDNGIIYTSFKHSEFEGMRNGRYFTDFTLESFVDFIKDVPSLDILEYWISEDVRQGREDEKWLNLILVRI
jgi:2-polyprenyl-3-methyl-5-hydroxy-6-metoxy-1,4-benzoquinol methylase